MKLLDKPLQQKPEQPDKTSKEMSGDKHIYLEVHQVREEIEDCYSDLLRAGEKTADGEYDLWDFQDAMDDVFVYFDDLTESIGHIMKVGSDWSRDSLKFLKSEWIMTALEESSAWEKQNKNSWYQPEADFHLVLSGFGSIAAYEKHSVLYHIHRLRYSHLTSMEFWSFFVHQKGKV